MLRYSFLPSDYSPMVLMLGETEDMRVLSELLLGFSQSLQDLELAGAPGLAPSDTRILLTTTGARLGMYPVSLRDKNLRWTLDSPTAELFSELVGGLAEKALVSGSERLLCGDYREVAVKVSRGEFTDDYLVFQPR